MQNKKLKSAGRSILTKANALAICATRARKILSDTTVGGFFASRSSANMKGVYGRSMIEMLGVLAIIGVLSAGGVWGYNLAMENHRANQTIDDMNTILTSSKIMFSGKRANAFQWAGADKLLNLGIIPAKYQKSLTGSCDSFHGGCTIKSLFNSVLYVGYLEGLYSDHRRVLWFNFLPVSKNICMKVMQFDWFNPHSTVASAYKISTRATGQEQYKVLTSKPSKAELDTFCTNPDFLDFYFDLKE